MLELDGGSLRFAITFISRVGFIESMGVFDVFKDEDKDSDDGGMTEEYRSEDASSDYTSEPEPAEEADSYEAPSAEQPVEETTSYSQTETAEQSQIGIEQLMGKRLKLEEAIGLCWGND